MKFAKLAVASAALLAAISAQAVVTGTTGSAGGSFLTLSHSGDLGGIAQFSGDFDVLSASNGSFTKPVGTVGNYVGVEGDATAKLTFGSGVSYLSFLWGSADSYNELWITESNGKTTKFTAAGLGLSPVNGTGGGQYVEFTDIGSTIKSLKYANAPKTNSFETANYSVTPVPEPETYALMLAGLGMVGFIARRRRG
ncbi:MAG: PEPxxWA-CTERM sorting domain-containing protein [Pseudomonadota bacterium]|nr:PEPxxWA-CTERM sorting domain-containing protein [Pseudomonadota bacterium]